MFGPVEMLGASGEFEIHFYSMAGGELGAIGVLTDRIGAGIEAEQDPTRAKALKRR